jgi:acetyl esterase
MPLNDALTAFLEEMAAQGVKPIHESTPEEVRGLTAGLAELYGKGPDMARVEDATIPVEGGAITARILVPTDSPRAVFIYYHGGGWVIGGNVEEFDTLGRKLAARTNSVVVLVDYRLAPEHRYPVAVDDSYAALEWVHAHLDELAGGQVPIIVGGDSAGGNLAAIMAQRSRDRGGPPIAFQALVYPVTDADLDNASYRAAENQLMLNRDSMVWFWDHYLPDADRRAEVDASPLRTKDFAGLPPAIVLTAEYDVLRDEGEAYADRLQEAGVPVERHRHPGQMHGFFTLLMVPGHEEAIERIATALDAHVFAPAHHGVDQQEIDAVVDDALARLASTNGGAAALVARATLAEQLSAVAHHRARDAVAAACTAGASWDEIGHAFGMSADNVRQHFGSAQHGLPE